MTVLVGGAGFSRRVSKNEDSVSARIMSMSDFVKEMVGSESIVAPVLITTVVDIAIAASDAGWVY